MSQQSTWATFLSAAVTAALVSSIFSLVSLRLQHRWEDRRQWQDRKRHVYATFLHLAGLLFTSTDHSMNQALIIEERLNANDPTGAALSDANNLLDKEDREIESLNSKLGIELEELFLLAPRNVRRAAYEIRQQLAEVAELVTADAPALERHEALVMKSDAFESAMEAFREVARQDLDS